MEPHRIAVISDTHGLLRPEIIEILKLCECILHAGDIGRAELLHQLEEICPSYSVRGNADREWAAEIPEMQALNLWGFRIFMVHNRKQIPKNLTEVDMIIYGHSHKFEIRSENGVTFLNPGSCGPKRFHLPITMMILTLYEDKHCFETKRIEISAKVQKSPEIPDKDMDRLIRQIIKEIKSGRSVDDIAAFHQIDRNLADQICRIYLTHPGVDIDGILRRMEIWGL